MPIVDGRWINPTDDSQKRAVVVLGDEARRVLFSGRPAIRQHHFVERTPLQRDWYPEENRARRQQYVEP